MINFANQDDDDDRQGIRIDDPQTPYPNPPTNQGEVKCSISWLLCIVFFIILLTTRLPPPRAEYSSTNSTDVILRSSAPWQSNHTTPNSLHWPGELKSHIRKTHNTLVKQDISLFRRNSSTIVGAKHINRKLQHAISSLVPAQEHLSEVVMFWNSYQTLSARRNEHAMSTLHSLPTWDKSARLFVFCPLVQDHRDELALVIHSAIELNNRYGSLANSTTVALRTAKAEWDARRVGHPTDDRLVLSLKYLATSLFAYDFSAEAWDTVDPYVLARMKRFLFALDVPARNFESYLDDLKHFLLDLRWINSYMFGIQLAYECEVGEGMRLEGEALHKMAQLGGLATEKMDPEVLVMDLDRHGVRDTYEASWGGKLHDEDDMEESFY